MTTETHLDPEPQDALSRELTRALEAPQAFHIPSDFAARTAAAAAELPIPVPQRHRPSLSALVLRGALAVLAIAMVAIAAWVRTTQNLQQLVLFGTEIALALEFVALTTWVSLRPSSSH